MGGFHGPQWASEQPEQVEFPGGLPRDLWLRDRLGCPEQTLENTSCSHQAVGKT